MKYLVALLLVSLSVPAFAYNYRCSFVGSTSTHHNQCDGKQCWDYTFEGGPEFIGLYLGTQNLFRVGNFHRSTLATNSPSGYTQFEGTMGINNGGSDAELQVSNSLISGQSQKASPITLNYIGQIFRLECQ